MLIASTAIKYLLIFHDDAPGGIYILMPNIRLYQSFRNHWLLAYAFQNIYIYIYRDAVRAFDELEAAYQPTTPLFPVRDYFRKS